MNKNSTLGALGILYVVQNQRSVVIALLLKNGVTVNNNASDIEIALLVTNLLKISKSFYREFTPLLFNEDVISALSFNMNDSFLNVGGGVNPPFDFSIFNGGTQPPPTNTTTNTSQIPTSTTPKPSTINRLLELLQTGFQGYLQLDDNKTKRELADASVIIADKDEELPPKTKLSTGAIVGISLLGVTVVGLIVYLIYKNKNQ